MDFLPKKKKELHSRLQELIKKTEAVVFFESPRRIRRTLSLLSTLTDRKIFLIKEMTKTFEDSWSGSASELLFQLDQDPKGEFVGVLEKVELSENITMDAGGVFERNAQSIFRPQKRRALRQKCFLVGGKTIMRWLFPCCELLSLVNVFCRAPV